jgi:hypothetical protein
MERGMDIKVDAASRPRSIRRLEELSHVVRCRVYFGAKLPKESKNIVRF